MWGAVEGFWNWWKRVARRIGDIQARFILTVFYFGVLAPFALVVRSTSDPLGIRPGTSHGWRVKGGGEGTPMEQAMRQS